MNNPPAGGGYAVALHRLLDRHDATPAFAPLVAVLTPHLIPRPHPLAGTPTPAAIDLDVLYQVVRVLTHEGALRVLGGLLAITAPYLPESAHPVDYRRRSRARTDHAAAPAPLRDREREVLAGIASGKTNAGIARGLALSEDTVKTHLRCLFSKLGARDRAHAVALAYQTGLLLPATPPTAGAAS